MRADAMDGSKARLITRWSPTRTHPPSAKVLRLSQLRKLRGCAQVAAVCYRVRPSGIEFLLVRTNSGHWTFPKGKAEPGLTHAQAAALEAFEEAGVHGRMEEASFTRYVRRKRGAERDSAGNAVNEELAVQAHLCEVSRLEPPQEANRHPTWFSPEKAKRRLREDRSSQFAAELARVVDRAVTRIQRLRGISTAK
jgi:8-oxo-dGTP pyrophosphatase MutT (NUDIX family)